MCGICGVLQVRGEPRPVTTQGVLDRMADVMTHRGPDDRGTFIADCAALGVRRLSIIDIEGGHQPMTNEDGVVIGSRTASSTTTRSSEASFARTATRSARDATPR